MKNTLIGLVVLMVLLGITASAIIPKDDWDLKDFYNIFNVKNITAKNITADYFFGNGSQLDISAADLTDDNTYVQVIGDTMTGDLNINANLIFGNTADRTIKVEQAADNTHGDDLIIIGGQGAGNPVENWDGGDVIIDGGIRTFSGNVGDVLLATLRGFVGIGTSTPQNLLNVLGDANITGNLYRNNKLLIDWSQAINGTLAEMSDILGFSYYNSTDFSISDYFTKSNILGFSYYNSTDFSISNYYLKSNPFGFWNDTYATFNKTYADTLYSTGDHTTDTNETTRVNALVVTDCAAGTLVIGIQANGTVLCATDAGGIWTNVSGTATFTGDANITGDIYSNSYQVLSYQRTVNIKNVTMTAVI